MAQRNGKIHAANLEKSPRLQRVLKFLQSVGERGATTMEILVGARVAVAGTAVSELRSNGINVDCQCEGKNDEGANVYRYRLASVESA